MPKKTEPKSRPIDPSDKMLEDLIAAARNLALAEDVIAASGRVLKAAYELSVYFRDEK